VRKLGVLGDLELRMYDHLLESRSDMASAEDIVFVDFNDTTMSAMGYPIPRHALANVIRKIAEGHPTAIGIDILLDKKGANADDDEELRKAIETSKCVILADNFGGPQLSPAQALDIFRDAAYTSAFTNLPGDRDGFVRRMYFGVASPDYEGNSFPLELAETHVGKEVEDRNSEGWEFAGHRIPLDNIEPNSFLVGVWPQQSVKTVPVLALLSPGFDSNSLRGKAVIVGQSSSGGKDLYHTPLFRFASSKRRMVSGAEIHALAFDTLVTGRTIRPASMTLLFAVNVIATWLAVLCVMRWPPLIGVCFTLGLMAIEYEAARLLIRNLGLWLPIVSCWTFLLISLPVTLRHRYAEIKNEQGNLMSLFGRYVAPEVAEELWRRRDELKINGEEVVATILFSDIREFTKITADKDCKEVLVWLNDYFAVMSEIISRNGGYLNKFMGDGLMVLFGVPLSHGVERDCTQALRTAIEMQRAIEEWNSGSVGPHPKIKIGIGIHTGKVICGSVGAPNRLEYSVIGENVNLASRLESLTKVYSTPIVLSADTNALVSPYFKTSSLGAAEVRGFAKGIEIYAVHESLLQEVQK
jgi:adenylate cyclase